MGLIHLIELNHLTLLILFVLPFAYHGYHLKFWYRPERVKFFDFLLSALSVVVLAIVLLKIIYLLKDGHKGSFLLYFLHMGPPLLALFAANHRPPSLLRQAQTVGGGTSSATKESKAKFKATKKESVEQLGWDDLVVSAELKRELQSVIKLLKDSKTASNYGIEVPKGILFNGPPGTGKTTIARVVANTAELSFFVLRADEIVSKWVGESEKNLTEFFNTATKNAPAIIFIDEIDSLGKARSDQNAAHTDNLLNHLLQLIDGVIKTEGIYIIGATNRVDLVDDALKRAGRLNRVLEISLPDYEARIELFKLYLKKLKLAGDVDLEILAEVTEGNSAADVKAICNQAGMHAYQREAEKPEDERDYSITSEDIEKALSEFAVEEDEEKGLFDEKQTVSDYAPLNQEIEEMTWEDLIVQTEVKDELMSVIELLKDPDAAKNYGIKPPKGILLNGPPGTGKTTIAKVMANTAGLSFFVLRADEIISKWVGESEKNLTRLFRAAMKWAPSIIFVDEIDSIGKNRAEGNAQHGDNLLNHFLQLIDGVVKTEGLYIIAATNRADLVDPALKRGGRLNRVIEIPLPDYESRKKIFNLYLEKLNINGSPDLDYLAARTEGKSAADIQAICNQSGLNAFKRESSTGSRNFAVQLTDIEDALMEYVGSGEMIV